MLRTTLTGLSRRGLATILVLFFLALALPSGILIQQAYSRLKWEAFHQHQGLAESLAQRIDGRISRLVAEEEARSFTDYSFLNIAGDPAANFLQRSPLASYPISSAVPGLIGYFQVDSLGGFTTPLLPAAELGGDGYGISGSELAKRRQLQRRIRQILGSNQLVVTGNGAAEGTFRSSPSAPPGKREQELVADSALEESMAEAELPAESAGRSEPESYFPAQAAFDRLEQSIGRVEKKRKTPPRRAADDFATAPAKDLATSRLRAPVPASKQKLGKLLQKNRSRKEQSVLPESLASSQPSVDEQPNPQAELRIRTFESEIDPFSFSLLQSGHLVLYRKVWRDGERYIQGALIQAQAFLDDAIGGPFRESRLSRMSDLAVRYRDSQLSLFPGSQKVKLGTGSDSLQGELLYHSRLSSPMSDLKLVLTISRLPAAAGTGLIHWVAAALVLVLCAGFYLMYRLGSRQIELARQQQDFVSAVSHELKTPLTSIRMYGEMLREGWADESKRGEYYGFIHDESERLSRLIENVLQLARMTRNEQRIHLEQITTGELLETLRPKIAAQVTQAGFELALECDPATEKSLVLVDRDAFSQVLINLVDNALKFSREAQVKRVEIHARIPQPGEILISVRDYGPGIPRNQLKKIFRLFYRSGEELTRETLGTGIGLALVRQLMGLMGGRVDAVNRSPGAEFRLSLSGQPGQQ